MPSSPNVSSLSVIVDLHSFLEREYSKRIKKAQKFLETVHRKNTNKTNNNLTFTPKDKAKLAQDLTGLVKELDSLIKYMTLTEHLTKQQLASGKKVAGGRSRRRNLAFAATGAVAVVGLAMVAPQLMTAAKSLLNSDSIAMQTLTRISKKTGSALKTIREGGTAAIEYAKGLLYGKGKKLAVSAAVGGVSRVIPQTRYNTTYANKTTFDNLSKHWRNTTGVSQVMPQTRYNTTFV